MSKYFSDDGSIDINSFTSWQDIDEFVNEQERAWSWSWSKGSGLDGGAVAVAGKLREGFQRLRTQLSQQQAYGQPHTGSAAAVKAAFEGPGGLLASIEASQRPHIVEIADGVSTQAALFALGIERRLVSLSDARTSDDMKAALWLAVPGLPDPNKFGELLKRERNNAREAARALASKVAEAEIERQLHWESLVEQSETRTKLFVARHSKRLRKTGSAWRRRHQSAEASIRAVEQTYKEHMGLAAPVDYWQTKAKAHRKAENEMQGWLMLYFPLAFIFLCALFAAAGIRLLEAPEAALRPGVYVIASAGLASAAGMLFWIGRLLTKLYLSQHHLRQDAEERATMTKTYLALMENEAAKVEDRQVILNALFRNTPDGIVKEDGGLDPTIAAALGKYLAKP